MRNDPLGVKHRIAPSAIVALAFLGVSSAVQAAEIHKCAAGSAVAYQTAPCAPGQRELAMATPLSTPGTTDSGTATDSGSAYTDHGAGSAGASIRDSARSGTPASAADLRWLPFRPRTIAAGMTDDEVLNAPNGGVPDRIDRARDGHTWRELWVYQTRGRVRELQFVNGRLTSIVDDDAPATTLQLALSRR